MRSYNLPQVTMQEALDRIALPNIYRLPADKNLVLEVEIVYPSGYYSWIHYKLVVRKKDCIVTGKMRLSRRLWYKLKYETIPVANIEV